MCRFSATKWYHVGHFAMPGEHAERVEHKLFVPPPPPAPPGCRDAVEQTCPGWAETGECETNPVFMVGTADQPGSCLLSCRRCDLMAHRNSNEVR